MLTPPQTHNRQPTSNRQSRPATGRRTADHPGNPATQAYGGQIDISDVWEAFYWCNSLGCTFEELRAAVKLRGTSATAVRAYFDHE